MTISEGSKLMVTMPYRVMLYRPDEERLYCIGESRMDEHKCGYYAVTRDGKGNPAISGVPLSFSPYDVAFGTCELVFTAPEAIAKIPTYYEKNDGCLDFPRELVKVLFGDLIADYDEARERLAHVILEVTSMDTLNALSRIVVDAHSTNQEKGN